MTSGQLDTYGPGTHVKVGSGGRHRVIDPPVLEEGVTLSDVIEEDWRAKKLQISGMKSALTGVRKQDKAYNDAGVWCATRGVGNPVSSIGGSSVEPEAVDELEKLFNRFIRALRKGVPLTLEGLNAPLS